MIAALAKTLTDICYAEEMGRPVRPLANSAIALLQSILREHDQKIEEMARRIERLERK